LITPWNWPMNQVAAKVVPALAAGCTMVLKPSEYSPFSAVIWAKVMHEAGVPAGVFNLINGDGPGVGGPLSSHREVEHGLLHRIHARRHRSGQERRRIGQASTPGLGGKSPNVLLDDADFERAVKQSVLHVFQNSGQSCNAPTRMLVPAAKLAEVEAIAKRVAESVITGDPASDKTNLGPVVSNTIRTRRGLHRQRHRRGRKGGDRRLRKAEGLSKGYFVKPTIFSNVRNDMTIAREEIFGPVLCILPYDSEEQAVQIANDTPYGPRRLCLVARQSARAAGRRADSRRPGDLERRLRQYEYALRRL